MRQAFDLNFELGRACVRASRRPARVAMQSLRAFKPRLFAYFGDMRPLRLCACVRNPKLITPLADTPRAAVRTFARSARLDLLVRLLESIAADGEALAARRRSMWRFMDAHYPAWFDVRFIAAKIRGCTDKRFCVAPKCHSGLS